MFIKTSKRKQGDKVYESHYLVEGYRDKKTGKVKHHNLACLTKLPSKQLLALKESLDGETRASKLKFEDLQVIDTKEFGGTMIFEKLFDKNFGKDFGAKFNSALKAIIINKIFEPKRKNSLPNWLKKVDFGRADPSQKKLYQSLDWLKGNWHTTEKKLLRRHRGKLTNDILFYIFYN